MAPPVAAPKPRYRDFFVAGLPAPQGSKRHVGNGRMIEASTRLPYWRSLVAVNASNAMRGHQKLTGPVEVILDFVLPRPKATPARTPHAVKRPDVDKLARAVLDAVTHTIIQDDSQVVVLTASKYIAEIGQTTGVHIHIEEL